MAKNNNFVRIVDKETGEETYRIQFNYGTQKIGVKEGTKIILDFIHGGFRETFSRVGNDLVIGDNTYHFVFERLGIGFGKEVWNVIKNEDSTYTIEISKYYWQGNTAGYSGTVGDFSTKIMSAEELADFQSQHKVTVTVGYNTLYTTWPVLPNPQIHYHMNDCGDYAPANGKIILTNYFKYGKNSVFIGDKLLSDIIQSSSEFEKLINKNSKKSYNITDTFFSENLYGGDRADKIRSYMGNDTIEAGKGNDKIILGEGNKTIVISYGDGKDTVYNFNKADSVEFSFDESDDIKYTKSGNNLVINRKYGTEAEKTVINNYFKNWEKDNKIIISNGDTKITDNLTQELIDGTKYLTINSNSKVIKGTVLSDLAYSSDKNETFALGQGNNRIVFANDGDTRWFPYSFGSDTIKLVKGGKVTLDFSGTTGTLSYTRKGNDIVITSRYRIAIAGRSNGKEEWLIKKGVNNTYNITKKSYYFTGDGYKSNGTVTEVIMTKSELEEFQKENNVKLKTGNNTLYTSWAVVPNPQIHYSMKDGANWGKLLGTITLKDYFKLNEDNVYIGDTSLRDILKNVDDIAFDIDRSDSKKSEIINDSYLSETIIGTNFSDTINSDIGNDKITGGQGDDKIVLGEGNKTVNISKGDGKDTLIILKNNTSANIVLDENIDKITFRKSGNNLVINRGYDDITEHTVIRSFYKNNLDSNIKIYIGNSLIFNKLDKNITDEVYEVVSKYPQTDATELKYTVKAESELELICGYTPFDTEQTAVFSEITQDVAGWQSYNNGYSSETINNFYQTDENIPLVSVQEILN